MTDRAASLCRDRLGAGNVRSDPDSLAFFGHDIAGPAPALPAAVARPPDVPALQALLADLNAAGVPVLPRGAGLSYSGGYLPPVPGCVLLDLGALDRVTEIATADRRVTVQAGASWRALHAALADQGLRTPFFGPLSGHAATIGGALSQRAAFFGSAAHGSSDGAVLSLDVVLADGRLLRTGSAAAADLAPFARLFGPDMTGLFLGDCGAFGIKTAASLQALPAPAETGFASFAFAEAAGLVAAQVALAGLPGLADCYGFDPVSHGNLDRQGFSALEGAALMREVGRSGGLKAAWRMARSGRAFVRDLGWSLHLVFEADSQAALQAIAAQAGEIAAAAGGRPVPDTIPRVTRAKPFRPVKAFLGPDGETWLPLHGLLPLTALAPALQAVEAFRRDRAAALEGHGIRISLLTAAVGTAALLEPQLFWPDALSPFHRGAAQPDQLAAHAERPANPAARAAAHQARRDLIDLLDGFGASHLQLGRSYRYADRLSPEALALARAVKAALDPRGLMNPGVLGL